MWLMDTKLSTLPRQFKSLSTRRKQKKGLTRRDIIRVVSETLKECLRKNTNRQLGEKTEAEVYIILS